MSFEINMSYRIKIDDNRLFPMQAFLNVIPDEKFVEAINNLVHGIGVTFNDVGCCFPDDIDSDDESFEGLCFGVLNEEIIISWSEFLPYLKQAALAHVKKFPEDSEVIRGLLHGL